MTCWSPATGISILVLSVNVHRILLTQICLGIAKLSLPAESEGLGGGGAWDDLP